MIILPVVPVIFSALRIIPKWQVTNSGIAKAKDLFEAENEARKTLAQIVLKINMLLFTLKPFD